MAIDLVACPTCGGCGYVGDGQCEGCCAQGYVPVEVHEPRCPVCGAESGGDLCDACDGYDDIPF